MIILQGQTPSHKNSKQLSLNAKTGKLFPRNNDKYLAWKTGAILEAKASREKYTGEVSIEADFFVKDKRHRDLDNMMASVQDVLVEAGVIEDDNVFILHDIRAIFGGMDAKNPKAVILIKERK